MVQTELNERALQVLQAVILDYIRTAEPVGSQAVAKHYAFKLSPATVRNTMAELEERGYLTQPHTSAGRVPTDKAYRLYVNALSGQSQLSRREVDRLHRAYATTSPVDDLMDWTAQELSRFSHYVAVVLAPPLKQTVFARLDLTPLPDDQVLALVVTDSGWVTSRIITLPASASTERLVDLARSFTGLYGGKAFQEILDRPPLQPGDAASGSDAEIINQVLSMLRDRNLYIGGAINILDHPEFWDLSSMRAVFRTFEEKRELIGLLSERAEESGVSVMIGRENPYEEMQECSLVTSTYTYRDRVLGILGVVGPKRMPYTKVVPLVDYTAKLVSRSLARLSQDLHIPS
ncbi:MAG TPA: heat-inducible transcriptional repressor HrcA [Methylomirabilota bacterium]|nr:heat-inducible transcriptional repressor HrcA [Methylomirabilota bacterium]